MTRLATDVGGTFTDLVAFDEATGRLHVAKTLTTPADPSRGVITALEEAVQAGLVLASVHFFVHGGTTIINAITERRGAPVALLTTRGFRDVIAIGRGNRPDLYNLQARSPEPFVPRHLRFEVTERIDALGRVREPLSLPDIDKVAADIAASNVNAVAILFLHAYRNPEHEVAAAAHLRRRLPGVHITASHEVSGRWREYERGNTAVLTAYVRPIIDRYLENLEQALEHHGYRGPRYVMQSSGGVAAFQLARAAPLTLIESGPAGGVAGAVAVGGLLGAKDVLFLDVGGTTAKCSLISGGRPVLQADYALERTRLSPGYPVQVPVVDLVEIGAGGGSIAWIDAFKVLRVGPRSAGADPGPACYGRGGTAPTVTDAKLVTGMLDSEGFVGVRMRLDLERARAAFVSIAAQLGCKIEAAAEAVISVAEARMIDALKLVTVQRGHDPRDMILVASGGAGPMHAAALGRELGVRCIVIPRFAGLFSAWGMLSARPRVDLSRSRLMRAAPDTVGQARAIFAVLESDARGRFGIGPTEPLDLSCAIEMRYLGQEHTVRVPFESGIADLGDLIAAFHAAHQSAFTFKLDDTPAELVTFHLSAEIDAPRVGLPIIERPRLDIKRARRGSRLVLFGADEGARLTPLYDRDLIGADATIDGPALIIEDTATTVVLPGQRLHVEAHGLLLITELTAH
jgi:N-methylhydantoinase A